MGQAEQIKLIYLIIGTIAIILFLYLVLWLLKKLIMWLYCMTKRELCILGKHKLIPIYIKGEIKGVEIKFIGSYCDRCNKGYKELMNVIKSIDKMYYNTYKESYFNTK